MATRTKQGGRPAAARVVPTVTLTVQVPEPLYRLMVKADELFTGEPFNMQTWLVQEMALELEALLQEQPHTDDPIDNDDVYIEHSMGARLGFPEPGEYGPFTSALAKGEPEAVAIAGRMIAAELAPCPPMAAA